MIKNKKDKSEKNSEEKKEVEIKISGSGEEENTSPEHSPDETDKVKELEAQVQQLKDQYLRTAAEFENYKRRTDLEKAEFFAYAGERLLTDLLPVVDDFNRTMASFEKSHDNEALKKGIDIVYAKFRTALEKQGLKEMDSDGKKFDVNLHEAILQQPDETKDPETVLNTVEKGYFLKDKVLRHAKVVVSSKPE